MALVKTIIVGEEIPSLSKTAYIIENPKALNPIHSDDFARAHGMRGALVPGSTLLSYVLEMLYNHFKERWIYHGRIKAAFIGGGAVNGDLVTARGLVTAVEPEAAGTRIKLNVWMENRADQQEGYKIIVGEASCLQ
ncbi:MAG: MaoC family dehydratase [Candidatus Tectomicrobia bacterium]|uniref:MaoC family dehydratase n=1 Tax=Tectimicrobiota bacterium TaxID=2528274 RepID=A0A933LRG9_UNCTE|nr:MaoC family dehydratase [Candidatus Tectomicrobia bacterium]